MHNTRRRPNYAVGGMHKLSKNMNHICQIRTREGQIDEMPYNATILGRVRIGSTINASQMMVLLKRSVCRLGAEKSGFSNDIKGVLRLRKKEVIKLRATLMPRKYFKGPRSFIRK